MLTPSSVSQPRTAWQDLYKAALFESDSEIVSQRIADAEKALVMRARELFGAKEDNIEEEYALDDAMYALHALRGAWEHRRKATSVTSDVSGLQFASTQSAA
jgi:hypothetical protein